MATDGITPEVEARLKQDDVVWFTTVRSDGMPQPTPVWFVWQDGAFLIYTTPDSQKVRNIRANPKVAVNLDNTGGGSHYTVFMGEATVDANAPVPSQVPAYIEKYRQGIRDIGMTPESFDRTYSAAIRVKPGRVRGE